MASKQTAGKKATAPAGNLPVKLESAYPALAGGGVKAAVLRANLGNEELTTFDLDRIRIPTSGGKHWEVPTGDGETEPMKEVEGIIVFSKMGRSFWRKGMDEGGGGTPPDCSSPDNVHGIGDPGVLCKTCRYAQFGSAEKGGIKKRGQACKQQRFIFLLREGSELPAVIALPPTSLKLMKKYFFMLAGKNLYYYACVTRFELVQDRNAEGVAYSKCQPSLVRALTPDEVVMVEAYGKKTQESFEQYHEGIDAAGDAVGGAGDDGDEDEL